MRLGVTAKHGLFSDPGAVSCCVGGVCYGIYQFNAAAGTLRAFVAWLNEREHPYGRMLGKFAPGTREFSCCWQYIGEHDPEEFEKLQHEYVKEACYDPAVAKLRQDLGLNAAARSLELQSVILLAAVRYGPSWIADLFREAAGLAGCSDPGSLRDEELIPLIHTVESTGEWRGAYLPLEPIFRTVIAGACLSPTTKLTGKIV